MRSDVYNRKNCATKRCELDFLQKKIKLKKLFLIFFVEFLSRENMVEVELPPEINMVEMNEKKLYGLKDYESLERVSKMKNLKIVNCEM